ncbi:MAG: rod-binding protein [Planctomycetota bacterium]|jgi:Rod binding domain-containing protein
MNIPSASASLNTMLLESQMKADISSIRSQAEADAKRIEQLQKNKEEDKLKSVAQEFAALFMGEMFKAMDNNENTSQLGFGGSAEAMFRDMAYDEYAKEATKAPDNGLAEIVYRSLSRRSQL